MSTTNKMLDIISAIDETQTKDELIIELSDPILQIGFKTTVLKLINKMIDLGFIEESSSYMMVTEKGRQFYDSVSFEQYS